MIDIHSHIVYGVDDGAQTLDQSLAMLSVAADSGTTDIVATPHCNLEYQFSPETIAARIAEIRTAVGDRIRIHSGCDFHLRYESIQDAIEHPEKYSINGLGYLMVEFSELIVFNSTEQILAQLLDAGMIPVVTHPERNHLLRAKPERLARWVDMGCYLQVTAQSLLAGFGSEARKFSEMMLRKGLVHFIASDAHDTKHRPPRLDLAHAYIAEQFGAELADTIFVDNPRAVIDGLPLSRGPLYIPTSAKKPWYQFWA